MWQGQPTRPRYPQQMRHIRSVCVHLRVHALRPPFRVPARCRKWGRDRVGDRLSLDMHIDRKRIQAGRQGDRRRWSADPVRDRVTASKLQSANTSVGNIDGTRHNPGNGTPSHSTGGDGDGQLWRRYGRRPGNRSRCTGRMGEPRWGVLRELNPGDARSFVPGSVQ